MPALDILGFHRFGPTRSTRAFVQARLWRKGYRAISDLENAASPHKTRDLRRFSIQGNAHADTKLGIFVEGSHHVWNVAAVIPAKQAARGERALRGRADSGNVMNTPHSIHQDAARNTFSIL